jgi:CubicO group peptidase (beta-lactamase class C family)
MAGGSRTGEVAADASNFRRQEAVGLRWLLSILLLSASSMAAGPSEPTSIPRPDGGKLTSAGIDATVQRLMQAAHVTGAGIALFHDGRIAYLKAYGLRDRGRICPSHRIR